MSSQKFVVSRNYRDLTSKRRWLVRKFDDPIEKAVAYHYCDDDQIYTCDSAVGDDWLLFFEEDGPDELLIDVTKINGVDPVAWCNRLGLPVKKLM